MASTNENRRQTISRSGIERTRRTIACAVHAATIAAARVALAGAVVAAVAAGVLFSAGARAEAGPTFVVEQSALLEPVNVIVYGDMRFTESTSPNVTNPEARRALVAAIAAEKPAGIFMSGDVPYRGGNAGDYMVYARETAVWRDANLRIYPALGNHEVIGCEITQCLDNWWSAFPQVRPHRWYSVAFGNYLYSITLDSLSSLLAGSDQRRWLEEQVSSLPDRVCFVLINMHHPPVDDEQTGTYADHNARPNEISLAIYLKGAASASKARFIVSAGHMHNYERFLQDDVTYLVSGGGGAQPYPVVRTPADLYQDPGFPNFHYVKLQVTRDRISASMFRLDATSPTVRFEKKDSFEIAAKRALLRDLIR